MGMKCEIETDQTTYCPGQTMNCSVQLVLNNPRSDIKSISVRFKGEALTKWRKPNGKSSITYKAKQEFFRNYSYIHPCISPIGDNIELSAGVYNYPVQFTLPMAIPSSCIVDYGSVRYEIKVDVETGRLFDIGIIRREFNVFVPLDLNEMSKTQLPVLLEESQPFYGCCKPSKPYRLTFKLPCSGFCNEQKIPICLECTNTSNISIKGIEVSLWKLLTYYAEEPKAKTKLKDIKLSELKFQVSIDKEQTKQFTGELLVPAATALNLANCSIIQMCHCIKITTVPSGCRPNGVFDVPVFIGHREQNSEPPIQMPSNEAMVQGPPSFEIAMQSSTSVVPENIGYAFK